MPTRILRLYKALDTAPDADSIVDGLDRIARPELRLICIWPVGPGERMIVFSEVLYHPSVPQTFRDDSKEISARYGLSPLARLALTSPLPFTLSEARTLLQLPNGGNAQWVFDFLAERGVKDGLYISFGDWMALFASDHLLKGRAQLTRDTRRVLHTAIGLAVFRLKELAAKRQRVKLRPTVDLSQRELVVLRRLSHGESTTTIAEELGLSVKTIEEYLARAKRKLTADNPTHAVAVALRKRLI